jgi:hypothetical protein
LFTFIPYFSEEGIRHHKNIAFSGIDYQTTLIDNLCHYDIGDNINPIAGFLTGTLKGMYAQSDPIYVGLLQASLDQYISNNASGAWGNFKDTTVGAMFVMQVAQGVAQLNVKGGVAETRFYYTELGLASLTSANMPGPWKSVKVGTGRTTFITQNVLYY